MDDFKFIDETITYKKGAAIKVVGVGGAGGNAVANMISASIPNVDFVVVNTDIQALDMSKAKTKVLLGKSGLGAGGNPEVARNYALDSIDEIRSILKDSDLIFITCGLGGGTGTGASPVIAAEAKSAGALTVAIVYTPPAFLARRKSELAKAGLDDLIKYVDSYIVVSNEGMQDVGHKLTHNEALRIADDVLRQSVQGISDMVSNPGHINIDFADVRTALSEKGKSVMGIGTASGENRAKQAFENTLKSPLLLDTSIKGAYAVMLNITANMDDLMNDEVVEIQNLAYEQAGDDALIFDGIKYDDRTDGSISVTLVATGINAQKVIKLDRSKLVEKQIDVEEILNRTRDFSKEDARINSLDDVNDNEDLFTVPTYLRKQAD